MNRKKLAVVTLMSLFVAAPLAFAAGDGATPGNAHHHAPSFKAHVLSRAELDQLLAQPDKVLLIDVRRPDELTKIGGFPVYLSIQQKDLRDSLSWIPRDRTIVTVSNHAGRAGKAADLLTSNGFTVAGAAGVQLYEKAGGKLTKIAPPAKGKWQGAAAKN